MKVILAMLRRQPCHGSKFSCPDTRCLNLEIIQKILLQLKNTFTDHLFTCGPVANHKYDEKIIRRDDRPKH